MVDRQTQLIQGIYLNTSFLSLFFYTSLLLFINLRHIIEFRA